MMLMCSFVYPLALTGVSQLTMKAKADGSKVDKDGNLTTDTKEAVGSALIGQDFTRGLLFSGKSFRCKLQYLYRRAERKAENMQALLPVLITTQIPIRN